MSASENHIERTISSHIRVMAPPQRIWDHITNVKLEEYADPVLFRLLNIPSPLKAEITSEGEGGERIAYFDNGKRFLQRILVWKPYSEYSFSFNPEDGFTVGFLFDISKGVFRILTGAYTIVEADDATLTLQTTYSLNKYASPFLRVPVMIVLKVFQRFLLTSIKANSER